MRFVKKLWNTEKFRYVDEVVIGAPYYIDANLLEHFNVDMVFQGNQTVETDEFGRDPYEIPKEVNKYRTIDSGNTMRTDDIIQRIIENR